MKKDGDYPERCKFLEDHLVCEVIKETISADNDQITRFQRKAVLNRLFGAGYFQKR